jgi:hypothetical protein
MGKLPRRLARPLMESKGSLDRDRLHRAFDLFLCPTNQCFAESDIIGLYRKLADPIANSSSGGCPSRRMRQAG